MTKQERNQAICNEYAAGATQADLAKEHDMSLRTIKRITKNVTRNVTQMSPSNVTLEKPEGKGNVTQDVTRNVTQMSPSNVVKDVTPVDYKNDLPSSLPPGYDATDAEKAKAQQERADLKQAICELLDAGEDMEYIIQTLNLLPNGCSQCRARARREKEQELERAERRAKQAAEPECIDVLEVSEATTMNGGIAPHRYKCEDDLKHFTGYKRARDAARVIAANPQMAFLIDPNGTHQEKKRQSVTQIAGF